MGRHIDGFDGVHGVYGVGERNLEGRMFLIIIIILRCVIGVACC